MPREARVHCFGIEGRRGEGLRGLKGGTALNFPPPQKRERVGIAGCGGSLGLDVMTRLDVMERLDLATKTAN